MSITKTGKAYLAKYDFRSKQRYIYRTNKLREIAGASLIITDAYEEFLKRLEELKPGWKIERHYEAPKNPEHYYLNKADELFEPDLDKNDGEVIYVGGGNLYILWKSRERALEANRILSEYLRDETYSLSPVCGLAPYTGDYAKDIDNLNRDFEQKKRAVPPILFSAVLPFTKIDRKTGLPVVARVQEEDLSQESLLKRQKYETNRNEWEDLDSMVREKGTESLLAVIYADGNNMGARVRETMKPGGKEIRDYREAVERIRRLSNTVQEHFVSSPRKAIEEMLRKKDEKYRIVIAGGDEMTLICKAGAALDVVKTYFEELDRSNAAGETPNTACVGVCIFHSHYPFSTAYAIAEECCENAKKANRNHGGNNCLVDFQHCFGGNIGTLETMRENDKQELIMRPYFWKGYEASVCYDKGNLAELERVAKKLKDAGRANIKNLSGYLIINSERFETEVRRLGLKLTEDEKKYIHDIAQFYDIWFAKGAEE